MHSLAVFILSLQLTHYQLLIGIKITLLRENAYIIKLNIRAVDAELLANRKSVFTVKKK
jgi:hypothetical protein